MGMNRVGLRVLFLCLTLCATVSQITNLHTCRKNFDNYNLSNRYNWSQLFHNWWFDQIMALGIWGNGLEHGGDILYWPHYFIELDIQCKSSHPIAFSTQLPLSGNIRNFFMDFYNLLLLAYTIRMIFITLSHYRQDDCECQNDPQYGIIASDTDISAGYSSACFCVVLVWSVPFSVSGEILGINASRSDPEVFRKNLIHKYLLIPWLLAPQSHQQSYYRLHSIKILLSFKNNNFKYLRNSKKLRIM